ncbi:uncharacterized protein LOC108864234, partial [Galendromus occidentalis]|uniref:Uncharacterized protein LOC108864234 n=1 Tax=Galendromus occidentalis TaxID=34638 RepID=A0AAJ7P9P8_9ACAR
FADDTTLILSHHDPRSLGQLSSKAITRNNQWMVRNGLKLNASKTKFIQFGRDAPDLAIRIHNPNCSDAILCMCERIEMVTSHKFLRLLVDRDQRFNLHVEAVCGKIRSGIAVLTRLKYVNSTSLKISIYFALVDAHIRYMIQVYGGTNESRSSEIHELQKKAVRIVLNEPYDAHSSPLFKLNIFEFRKLYAFSLVVSLISTSPALPKPKHDHRTRFKVTGSLALSTRMKTRNRRTPIANSIKLHNSLPFEIRNYTGNFLVCTRAHVRSSIKHYFLNLDLDVIGRILY